MAELTTKQPTPTFELPVDAEHKATVLKISSFSLPHMRAFHLAWIAFFTAFLSTFAPAAMGSVIRQDLDLTKSNLGDAGSAAVTGTIFCRLVMGTVCDKFGPRYGFAYLMIFTAPAVFCMSLADGAVDFILCRFFIGFSLATFVSCQFWCSVMFNAKIVGVANATAGGWGNLGGGVTQFLIPAVYTGMLAHAPAFAAWRWTFLFPGWMHVICAISCLLLAQDLPDGDYGFLKKTGQMEDVDPMTVIMGGVKNYRMWILTFTYGYCFGVELAMNNIIVGYFVDYFDMELVTAGIAGSMFGMMNLFARSVGGIVSDWASTRFGMRGRLWTLWLFQTVEGIFCIIMGRLSNSLAATIVVMICFSTCVQAAEGATFGVVPFISRRSLGVVSGFVGAGGNAGAAVMMNSFFKGEKGWGDYDTPDGISYMGVVIIIITLLIGLIHFPMWGGMFTGPSANITEEDYYLSDFTDDEVQKGLADGAKKFAFISKCERGGDVAKSTENQTADANI